MLIKVDRPTTSEETLEIGFVFSAHLQSARPALAADPARG